MRITLTASQRKAVKSIHSKTRGYRHTTLHGRIRVLNNHILASDLTRVILFPLKERVPDGVYDISGDLIAPACTDDYLSIDTIRRAFAVKGGISFKTTRHTLAADLEHIQTGTGKSRRSVISSHYIKVLDGDSLKCIVPEDRMTVIIEDTDVVWAIAGMRCAGIPEFIPVDRDITSFIGETKEDTAEKQTENGENTGKNS